MNKKTFIIAGVLLLVFAGLWYFLLSPRWAQRIPPGWKWEAHFVGIQAVPDERTGKFPDNNAPALYERSVRVIDEKDRPSSVLLQDSYVTRDPFTKKKTYEYITKGLVDPVTGRDMDPDHKGDYNLFPRKVEKKTYIYRANYIEGIPLTFLREDVVQELNTYVFQYKGRIEYTKSYQGTDEYPGVKVKQGQAIRCADDQFLFRVWVEPVTGEIARIEENCLSGDYIYESSTGTEVSPVMSWGGATAGDDEFHRLRRIKNERIKLRLLTEYIPLSLLLAGLPCLAGGVFSKRRVQER